MGEEIGIQSSDCKNCRFFLLPVNCLLTQLELKCLVSNNYQYRFFYCIIFSFVSIFTHYECLMIDKLNMHIRI